MHTCKARDRILLKNEVTWSIIDLNCVVHTDVHAGGGFKRF